MGLEFPIFYGGDPQFYVDKDNCSVEITSRRLGKAVNLSFSLKIILVEFWQSKIVRLVFENMQSCILDLEELCCQQSRVCQTKAAKKECASWQECLPAVDESRLRWFFYRFGSEFFCALAEKLSPDALEDLLNGVNLEACSNLEAAGVFPSRFMQTLLTCPETLSVPIESLLRSLRRCGSLHTAVFLLNYREEALLEKLRDKHWRPLPLNGDGDAIRYAIRNRRSVSARNANEGENARRFSFEPLRMEDDGVTEWVCAYVPSRHRAEAFPLAALREIVIRDEPASLGPEKYVTSASTRYNRGVKSDGKFETSYQVELKQLRVNSRHL